MPTTKSTVQQWSAEDLAVAGEALVQAGVVGPPTPSPTGLSSPLLFGRNGNLGANTFLRLAGGVAGGGDVGYPVSPGTVVTYIQAQTPVAVGADYPLIVVVNGVDDPTPVVLTAGSRGVEAPLNIVVPDSGAGFGTLTVRSGETGGTRAIDLSISVWTQEQQS